MTDLPLGLALFGWAAMLVAGLVQAYRGQLQPTGLSLFTGIALAGQIMDLAARAQSGPPPWQSLSGALLLAALLSAVFLISFRTFLKAGGFYTFGAVLPFGLLVMGALIRQGQGRLEVAGDKPWSLIHVPFAALGLAMLGTAAVAVGAYKIKAVRLKARQVKGVARLLPSLERLDRMVLVGAIGGFVCLTLSLMTGALWASHGEVLGGFRWTLKEISSLLAWLVYAVYLYVRLVARWQGAWPSALLMVGFALVGVIFAASGWRTGG